MQYVSGDVCRLSTTQMRVWEYMYIVCPPPILEHLRRLQGAQKNKEICSVGLWYKKNPHIVHLIIFTSEVNCTIWFSVCTYPTPCDMEWVSYCLPVTSCMYTKQKWLCLKLNITERRAKYSKPEKCPVPKYFDTLNIKTSI